MTLSDNQNNSDFFICEEYVGEFVISQGVIYLVSAAGQVREIDDTQSALVE